jgi:hypothetical protein
MSVQTKPFTFFNQTTADANQVNACLDVLYALQSGGIDSANMNMTAPFNFTGDLTQSGGQLIRVLSTTSGIDGKTVGTTNLHTVPTGKTAVIVGIAVRLTTATGLTGTMTAGVGVAAGEDDIIAPTVMTGLNSTGENFKIFPNGISAEASAGQIIKFGIDVAFGGTTVTVQVDLLGYYK